VTFANGFEIKEPDWVSLRANIKFSSLNSKKDGFAEKSFVSSALTLSLLKKEIIFA
jgi:hypothetical protein